LAVHKLWVTGTKKQRNFLDNNKLVQWLSVLLCFHFVCFCWIYFHAENFTLAGDMIRQITHNLDFSVWKAFYANYHNVFFMMLLGYLLHALPDKLQDNVVVQLRKTPLVAYTIILLAFAILYGFFKTSEPVMPIYLQF
jgi:alginate O-acetyltransferase complex protein AlgI